MVGAGGDVNRLIVVKRMLHSIIMQIARSNFFCAAGVCELKGLKHGKNFHALSHLKLMIFRF